MSQPNENRDHPDNGSELVDGIAELFEVQKGELSTSEVAELSRRLTKLAPRLAQPVERALMATSAINDFRLLTGRAPTPQLDDSKMLVSLFCSATSAMHLAQLHDELQLTRQTLTNELAEIGRLLEVVGASMPST